MFQLEAPLCGSIQSSRSRSVHLVSDRLLEIPMEMRVFGTGTVSLKVEVVTISSFGVQKLF